MSTETGGPAFPRPGDFQPQTGMTLRDYFAAKAMQGMLAETENNGVPTDKLATYAYDYADAMLKARNQ